MLGRDPHSGPAPSVWTVGHSTLGLEQFLELLEPLGIQAVADVRRYPGSRRSPHFSSPALAASLSARGIDYLWLPQLGGRRTALPGSGHTGWRSAAFRGYADHMASEEFAEGLDLLANLALAEPTAIMCAESLWWRCHRALLSDALLWLGFEVLHLASRGTVVAHRGSAAARIVHGQLTYAAP
jgi:uncharacterized protein (DUF488 family)